MRGATQRATAPTAASASRNEPTKAATDGLRNPLRSLLERRNGGSHLVILSHMRSFSSLLCHVPGSDPEIPQTEKRGSPTLVAATSIAWNAVREQLQRDVGRYALDKILHNDEIASTIPPDPKRDGCPAAQRRGHDHERRTHGALLKQREIFDPVRVDRLLRCPPRAYGQLGEHDLWRSTSTRNGWSGTEPCSSADAAWLGRPRRCRASTGSSADRNAGHGDPSPNIRLGEWWLTTRTIPQ